MDYQQFLSKIDTERFGFPIAKINSFKSSVSETMGGLKKEGVKLVMSKINASEIDLINEMEENGYRIKDGQSKYKFDLKRKAVPDLSAFSDKVIVRDYCEGDLPYLKNIFKNSFKEYGHYFSDRRLSRKACLQVYVDWGVQSCVNRKVADRVFVAEVDDNVAGMLAFRVLEKNGQTYAEGTLGAVSPDFRGMSIFKILAIHGLIWGKEQDYEWEEHNVLVNNYPVNSSFSSLGFKITDSFYTLHNWLEK